MIAFGPYRKEGAWWVVDGAGVVVRIAGPDDVTSGEINKYDPDCASCWLNHGHSGDFHRRSLEAAAAQRRLLNASALG